MIDRTLAFIGQLRPPLYDIEFGPDQSAEEQFYQIAQPSSSEELTVVFGFWHAPAKALPVIANRLMRNGSDVLVYDLNPDILNIQPERVSEGFDFLAKKAAARTNELSDTNNYKQINVLGFSLGNIPLSMSLENMNRFNKVTMVVPGTDLLRCLWKGIRTQRLRQSLIERGASFEELTTRWRQLAPAAHIDPLRGHPVEVWLARKDKFIPFKYGMELVELMQKAGINPELKIKDYIGHAMTIAAYIRYI